MIKKFNKDNILGPEGFSEGLEELINDKDKIREFCNSNYELVHEETRRDPLTQLYNQVEIENILSKDFDIASEEKDRFYVLFIDINHFKKINDTLGHLKGNEILKDTADILRGCIRKTISEDGTKSDCIGRYGGDEFLMILYDIRKEDLTKILERFVSRGISYIKKLNKRVDLGVKNPFAVGWAEFNPYSDDEISVDSLIREAEKNMYSHKKYIKDKN
ncbi:GGDEF domain-containing protein [Candidatus Woesearchaeota archaeon]|nr:GGDEF domain-containing protein [Candidatus Woesearchaeota archaeon]